MTQLITFSSSNTVCGDSSDKLKVFLQLSRGSKLPDQHTSTHYYRGNVEILLTLYLHGVLGEDERFDGSSGGQVLLPRGVLFQSFHVLQDLLLLLDTLDLLQTHADPPLHVQQVELSAHLLVSLPALHCFAGVCQSSLELLLLTIPLDLSLPLCSHANQVSCARLKEEVTSEDQALETVRLHVTASDQQ